MGVDTLHHHFRVLTAMSPLQYGLGCRRHGAACRLFGQPPMRGVRALRLPNAPPMESVGAP